jgi:hypothetical protein
MHAYFLRLIFVTNFLPSDNLLHKIAYSDISSFVARETSEALGLPLSLFEKKKKKAFTESYGLWMGRCKVYIYTGQHRQRKEM